MKITIERDAYMHALAKVSGTVSTKNTIPILSHIYHHAGDGYLTLRSTDQDMEITTKVECEVEISGECTLPSDLLNSIVKKYKKGEIVKLDATQERATISQGRSRFNLATFDAKEYPQLANAEYTAEFSMAANDLSRLFGKASFAVSNEEVRYYLNGIYFHNSDGNITAVSTDGHRLAKVWCGQNEDFPGVIVPRKTVAELRKILSIGNVNVSVSETKFKVDTGDTIIVSAVIDGTFPDYERIMPAKNNDMFRIDAAKFATAAGAVAIVSEDKMSRGVHMAIGSDSITLSVLGSINSADTVVDAVVYGGVCEMSYSSKYLADVLAQAEGGDVEFMYDAANPMTPGLVKTTEDDQFLAVVMPMRG